MSSSILLIFGTVVMVVALTEMVKQRLRISGIAAGIRPKSTSSDGIPVAVTHHYYAMHV